MRENICNNLTTCYNIIKNIHKLYIKYNKYIKYNSFASTGIGIDTIYNTYQIKDPKIYICICKVLYNDIYIILPKKIITIFGIWTFIDDPYIINIDDNMIYINQYMNELQTIFKFKFLFPAFYDEYFIIHNQMFIITQYNNYKYKLPEKFNNIKIDMFIHSNEKIKERFEKFSAYFFNNHPFGSDIIDYEFNKFIELLVQLNIIDDKKEYFKYYQNNKNNKILIQKFIGSQKNNNYNKKIYTYYKNIYHTLFYYNYVDYLL